MKRFDDFQQEYQITINKLQQEIKELKIKQDVLQQRYEELFDIYTQRLDKFIIATFDKMLKDYNKVIDNEQISGNT